MSGRPTTSPDKPQPLQYAHLPPAKRWSPVPMMIASGTYGILLIGLAHIIDSKFRRICIDFKIEIPTLTQWCFALSRWLLMDYGWIYIMPALILWPLAVIPFLPAPQQPESRKAIIRSARYLVILLFIMTLVGAAIAMVAPIIALIQALSSPQKH